MDTHRASANMPAETELVAFEHGAAGHQGLSSNAAGDLIIKPCVQAEIDFYEAAKDHPEFQAHMPTYMGKLELGTSETVQAMAPAMEENITDPPTATTTTTTAEPKGGATEATGEASGKASGEATSATAEPGKWVPSGGKKLETGLAIVLENATAGFVKPNVIDLKLGSRLWDDNAPEEKRQKLDQVAAETTSGSLGFRVAGMKVWLGPAAADAPIEVHTEIKDGYKSYDKNYGRGLDEQSVGTALATFFAGSNLPTLFGQNKSLLHDKIALTLARRLLREVESIQYVLEHEESRMYSASILVVIEGDPEALEVAMFEEEKRKEEGDGGDGEDDAGDDIDDDDDEELGPRVLEVRLIDFAHAAFTPGQGPDENVLRGVRSIAEAIKEVCN